MRKLNGLIKYSLIALCGLTLTFSFDVKASAKEGGKMLPSAGIDLFLSGGTSIKKVKEEADSQSGKATVNSADMQAMSSPANTGNTNSGSTAAASPSAAAVSSPMPTDGTNVVVETIPEEKMIEETVVPTLSKSMEQKERELDSQREEEYFKNLVIAQVDNYVNVRGDATTDSEIVGKLYDKSVGELLEEKDGWYKISSGSCTGYVNAEYCVTGDAAVELAKKVGTRVATVNTTTLKVREDASTEATVLGLVPMGEVLTVSEEMDDWVKVNIEEGDGFVSLDYVKLSTEFVRAESKEEEEARKAKEEQARLAAINAANAANKKNSSSNKSSSGSKQTVYASGGSELGRAVANYGLQFVGNPYVYGGTSLTNGADCSGFVMSVYKNFGVNLPHSSSGDRSVGYAVDGLANAQPGDLVCYSGHVALYIGNGQIVHASTAKTGIKVSNADYRTILAIRRIF